MVIQNNIQDKIGKHVIALCENMTLMDKQKQASKEKEKKTMDNFLEGVVKDDRRKVFRLSAWKAIK